MKKILVPLAFVLSAFIIGYAIETQGVDAVNLLGSVMIAAGLLITYKIFTAKTSRRKEELS